MREESKEISKKQEQYSTDSNLTQIIVKAHSKHLGILEQFTRKKNLIFNGVKEADDENTEEMILNLMKEKFQIDLNSEKIEYAKRITAENTKYR